MKLEHPLNLLKKRVLEKEEEPYGNEIITFLNPYSYLFFRKNVPLFKEFNRIFLDGIVLVKAMNIIGIHVERKSFDMTSLAPKIFQHCVNEKKSIYFVGSDPNSINKFISVIKTNYPNLNILGWRNGYFQSELEQQAAHREIIELNPEFLIIGMGTPLQENFLSKIKSLGWEGVGFTCGGFIHQTASGLNYYPEWIDKLNLRWLYRIWDEPKLLTRYLVQYPKFMILFFFDHISAWRD